MISVYRYHPHSHGSVFVQVDGGMAGMLIVEDDPTTAPRELLAMDDVVAVVQGLHMYNGQLLANQLNDNTSTVNVDLENPYNITHNMLVVNGQYKPILEIKPGELKRIRFVNANAMDSIYLGMNPNMTDADKCEMTLLALDGVYLNTPRQEEGVYLPSGSRADVAIRCNKTGQFAISTLDSDKEYMQLQGGMFSTHNPSAIEQDVIILNVSGEAVQMKLPKTFARKPSYLSDLRKIDDSRITDHWAVEYSMPFDSDVHSKSTVNDLPFNASTPQHSMRVGGIAQWNITSGNTIRTNSTYYVQHPHHQHTNHFQVLNSDTITGGKFFRKGDWRDTIPVWNNTPAVIRFHIADFIGPMVLHCHALKHEEMGMMTWAMIQDENGNNPTQETMRM